MDKQTNECVCNSQEHVQIVDNKSKWNICEQYHIRNVFLL